MSTPSFYSDRVNGPVARTHDDLPEATADGLKALVKRLIGANWLAERFPMNCPDGASVSDTDGWALGADLAALVPGVNWPLWQDAIDDTTLFDVLEYVGQRLSKPIQRGWHEWFKHYELDFDRKTGVIEYRNEVNQLLSRGGTVYEMSGAMEIHRVGSPEVQTALRTLRPATGDTTLDALLETARTMYLSRSAADRATAIEKLWDGFSRLKSLDVPGQGKVKQSVAALLSNITDEPFRDFIEAELRTLTDFGNQFQIRHHEVGQTPIPTDAQDYIVARMVNLIVLLLDQSGRFAPA